MSWELIPLSKEENEAVWEELENTRRGPKPPKDNDDENKGVSEYFVFLLDWLSRNLIYVVPLCVVLPFGGLFARIWFKTTFQKPQQPAPQGEDGKRPTIRGRTKAKHN